MDFTCGTRRMGSIFARIFTTEMHEVSVHQVSATKRIQTARFPKEMLELGGWGVFLPCSSNPVSRLTFHGHTLLYHLTIKATDKGFTSTYRGMFKFMKYLYQMYETPKTIDYILNTIKVMVS